MLTHTEKKKTTGRRMDPGSGEASAEVIENWLRKWNQVKQERIQRRSWDHTSKDVSKLKEAVYAAK